MNSLQKKSIAHARSLIERAASTLDTAHDPQVKRNSAVEDLHEAADWLTNVLNMRGSKSKKDDDDDDE